MDKRVLLIAVHSAAIASIIAEHPDFMDAGEYANILVTPEPPRAIEMRTREPQPTSFRFARQYHQDQHRPRDQYRQRAGRR